MNQRSIHDPEDLYEPFRNYSFPKWGIFGYAHPYTEIIMFTAGLAAMIFGTVLAFLIMLEGMIVAIPVFLLCLCACAIGVGAIYIAVKRVAWYRRYIRITGHKPTLGDPANQYPNVDTLPFWPRFYWKGKN